MADARHHHLDVGERHQIYALLQQGLSLRAIAKQLKRSVPTISRELKRYSGEDGSYAPDEASEMASRRRSAASRQPYKMPLDFWDSEIWSLLRKGWSPDQITSWRLESETDFYVSARWICAKIAEDRALGGDMHLYLRHKGRKRRMKTDAGRSRIPDRVGIASRPPIVDATSRVGDWEVDLIVGRDHKGCLLTLVERKTKFLLMCQLANKRADTAKRAIVGLLWPYSSLVHTITADNGTKFAQHAWFAKRLGAAVYFADPYSSWQRGLSEHTNGLVREYFPKRTRLDDLKPSRKQAVQEHINERPRKVLAYYTPKEAFTTACAAA